MAYARSQYSVRDRAGKTISGTLEADYAGAVADQLKAMGYAPISDQRGQAPGHEHGAQAPGFGAKVKLKDLAVFSRQFATMINSGLSLLRALNILVEQTDEQGARRRS